MARYKGFLVPATFADLLEVRKCWDILMLRTVNFYIILYSSNGAAFQQDMDLLRDEKEKKRETCISLLQQFEAAIKPLLETQPGTAAGGATTAGAMILYVSSKIPTIFLHTCSKPREPQYDNFTPRFVEIMDTIKLVILNSRRTQLSQAVPRTFNFDIPMLLPVQVPGPTNQAARYRLDASLYRQRVYGMVSCWPKSTRSLCFWRRRELRRARLYRRRNGGEL
jgi:hypothetical protein